MKKISWLLLLSLLSPQAFGGATRVIEANTIKGLGGALGITGNTTITGTATATGALAAAAGTFSGVLATTVSSAQPITATGSRDGGYSATVSNNNTGSSAYAALTASTNAGGIYVQQLATAAGGYGQVVVDGSAGLKLLASHASGTVLIYAGNTLAATFTGANAQFAGTVGITGVATLTAKPILSSLTASLPVFSDGSKGLVSNTMTGTGSVVMSTSPTLVTPALGTPSALVGTNITGTAAGLTAGNVTTNANLTGPITSVGNATSVASQTGTGSTFVMSASPTLTGTLTAAAIAASGDFAVATNKFTVASASGNTVVAGTLGVTGASTLAALGATTGLFSSTLAATGDFAINTDKFTVAASSGNTVVAGTLGVTGTSTVAAVNGTGLVDIVSPSATGAIRLSSVTTDDATKAGRIIGRSYHNADGNWLAADVQGANGSNTLVFGGGSGVFNSANQIYLYTGATTTTTTGSQRFGVDSGGLVSLIQTNGHADSGTLQIGEKDTTPSTPTDGTRTKIYMKADKYVIQYNHGGTVKYRYLDLTSTDATWTYTTSAP